VLDKTHNSIGVVVPTLGKRISIIDTIQSCIRCSRVKKVVVVKPNGVVLNLPTEILKSKKLLIVDQHKAGLAAAINCGVAELSECTFWNWCGDDDSISDEGMSKLAECLEATPNLYWGSGEARLRFLGLNISFNSSLSAFKILLQRYGPNLIAQPPLLFQLKHTAEIGGLDERFKFAFDQDLIQKFSKKSPPLVIKDVTGTYNWHPETLSNLNRKESQLESLQIRLLHARSTRDKMLIVFLFPSSTLVVRAINSCLKVLYKSKIWIANIKSQP
jgi:hypothetical protein